MADKKKKLEEPVELPPIGAPYHDDWGEKPISRPISDDNDEDWGDTPIGAPFHD